MVSPEATGPPYRNELTGTGFVATDDGLLLTNRHVVFPWQYDPTAQTFISAGYRPIMNSLVGYLPDVALDLGRLELVDGLEDDAQSFRVCRPEVLPVGPIGDGDQELLVDLVSGIGLISWHTLETPPRVTIELGRCFANEFPISVVAEVLGIEVPWPIDGESFLDEARPARPTKHAVEGLTESILISPYSHENRYRFWLSSRLHPGGS